MITKLVFLLLVFSTLQVAVTSNFSHGIAHRGLHKIRSPRGDVVLRIECLQNCPPVLPVCDIRQSVVLEAVCSAHCDGVTNTKFWWTVNEDDFNYSAVEEFGREMNILIISENSLEIGKSYRVEVKHTEFPSTEAFTILHTHEAPQLNSVTISTNEGDALKTEFLLNCVPKGNGSYVFEIYALSQESAFLLQRGRNCGEMPFFLSSEVERVKVKMIDEYQYFDSRTLTVTVHPVFKQVTNEIELENEIQKQYFDPNSNNSVSTLVKSENYDNLLQVLNVFSEDLATISNKDNSDTVKKYQTDVLNILSEAPMVSRERAKQAAKIAGNIAKSFKLKSDPDVAKIAGKVCEEAATKNLQILQKEAYPKSFEEEIQENSKMFLECSQAGTVPNMEILNVNDTVKEPTTPFPLLDIPAIVEDYPDYVDDQNVSQILSKYEDSSHSLVNLCYASSRTLALTMSARDVPKSVAYQNLVVSAVKAYGAVIPSVLVSSQDVRLNSSQDFMKFGEKEVEVLLCTITLNPFWWMKKQPTITSVAILQFQADLKIIEKFTKPFAISFENSNPNVTLISHSGITPRKPNTNSTEEGKAFEKFSIFRIDVSKKQGYFIEFQDLADSISLDVYVSVFEKPTMEMFKKMSSELRRNNSIIFVHNDFEYDTWHYLTILPNEVMGNTEVKFNFLVYTTSCYHWDESLRDWKFACGAAEFSSKAKIHCRCYHSSILTGKLMNNAVREEEEEFVEHELELQASFIVFVSVAVVFFAYCLILTCLSFTTEDKEHVLNYPDPNKKLLQKNQEDWFFLATEHYLGEIEKIELWFDCIGLRPSWYCRDIGIVDLQMNKYWYFNVNFKFEISMNKENHICTVFPTKPERKYRKMNFLVEKLSVGLQGPHMWNIFEPEEVIFSRSKRLTIMLSIFLTTYSVILFIYGCPKMIASDSLGQYKEYGFHALVIWASIGGLATTSIVHLPIVHFFRYCHKHTTDANDVDVGKINRISLKCWCSLIFLITLSMTILMVLGFWVPHITGLLWLTSSVVSIVAYVFLVENLSRIAYNLTSKAQDSVESIVRGLGAVIASIEAQRVRLYSRFGPAALRPYYGHLYKPMEGSRLQEFKLRVEMKRKIAEIVEDLIMIMIYVILLYMVILKDKDPMIQLSNKEVNDLVMGVHSKTENVISNRKEIQEYIDDTLIFSTQSLQWYGEYVSKDPGMTIDNVNKYIGVARLRQARSDNVSCVPPSAMVSLRNGCVPSFSVGHQRSDFGEAWMPERSSDSFGRMDGVWKFRTAAETGTLGFVGKFGTYPGSGYVSPLGRNMKNSLINANYLFRNKWIDEYTRCLFVEFLMYCANSNLFNSVEVRFEIGTTGYVRTKSNVNTARLLFVKEKTSILSWIILVSFVLVVSMLSLKMIVKVAKKKKLILKDLWHMVDILIISMSLACIFLYVHRTRLVKTFLETLEKAKHNEFINYFHLFHSEHVLTSLAAVLVFLATIRLWKLMRFLLIIRIVERTLILSAAPLFCMFLCHLVVMLAFTITGSILFGDRSHNFKDVPDTLITMVLLSLCLHNDFDFAILKTPLHYFYYSLYMIASLLVTNLFVAIVTICYADAQIFYSNDDGYSVVQYVKDQIGYYAGLVQIRVKTLRGGSDRQILEEALMVSPKADEHRYAKCLTVPKTRMDGMVAVALSTLRNKAKPAAASNRSEQLMKRTIVSLFREESERQEFFFISNVEGRRATLVDDARFSRMEKIVTQLLCKSNVPRAEREATFREEILRRNGERIDKIAGNLEVVLKAFKTIEFEQKV